MRAAYFCRTASLLAFTVCASGAVLGSASAGTFTLSDTGANAYWGGLNQYNPSNGDVIGDSLFDTISAVATRTGTGTTLTVVMNTNFYQTAPEAIADGVKYGSLFLTTAAWSPIVGDNQNNNAPPHYGSDVYQPGDWKYAVVMGPGTTGGTANLYAVGNNPIATNKFVNNVDSGVVTSYKTTTGTVVMSNVGGNPISAPTSGNPGFFFRQDQAVEFIPDNLSATLATGTWSVNTITHAITFSIVDNLLLGNSFALAWAMTCANDVIAGQMLLPSNDLTPTPLPAALPLFATGMGFLSFMGWRRKRRVAIAAA